MLVKDAAEVIAVENGHYLNYDFGAWTEIAALQKEFEPEAHSWVRTPHLDIAVPKIIRLFGYDRLPKQLVKLNRGNLYVRDSHRCQYCGSTSRRRISRSTTSSRACRAASTTG